MIRGWLIGERELIARLGEFPATAKAYLSRETSRLALKLLRVVKADKLTGQVLNVRTGRLRRSITQRVEESGGSVYGIVGTNLKYGRRHELGFTGTETVKAHLRMMKKAWGKPVKKPRKIMVSAHARSVKYPPRSFLATALEEMRPEIQAGLKKAVDQAARQVIR